MWSVLGDEPINQTARWVPEPQTRGTFSILSTCIVTLSLCVWTALHVNVPEPGSSDIRRLWWKIGWLGTGLLAPEMVALAAYRQWAEQRELHADMLKALGDRNPVPPKVRWYTKVLQFLRLKKKEPFRPQQGQRSYPWTTTHSFLAVMGGFVFDNTGNSQTCPFPQDRNRITLSSRGLALLARFEPDMIPDISVDAIRDKSKTNGLAKLLACLQALWFCTQVLTRVGEHLPVTLLELNTFAHALCALGIFVIWWNKPLDVSEAFSIPVGGEGPQAARSAALSAAFCTFSSVGRRFPCRISHNKAENNDPSERTSKPYRQSGFFTIAGEVKLDASLLDEYLDNAALVAAKSQHQQPSQGDAGGGLSYGAAGQPVGHSVRQPSEPIDEAPSSDGTVAVEMEENINKVPATEASLVAATAANASSNTDPAAMESFITAQFEDDVHFFSSGAFRISHFEPGSDWGSLLDFSMNLVDSVLPLTSTKRRLFIRLPPDFWQRIALATRRGGLGQLTSEEFETITTIKNNDLVFARATNLSFAVPRWYAENDAEVELFLAYTAAFAAASIVYSGWHLTAWNGPFHSATQELLWRGAAIGLGGASSALCLAILGASLAGGLSPPQFLENLVIIYIGLSVFVLAPLLILFLIACRLCLVVQSFIGLAYVSDGVFELPHWSVYFPHIA